MKNVNKEKIKNEPSSSMEEMFQRGEVGEFEHLKGHVEINQEGRYSFKAWLKKTMQDIMK